MAGNADLAPNWSGFSDVELTNAIGYRTEELLLIPLTHACMWCPEFVQYLYSKYNLIKEENVQQAEVTGLICKIRDFQLQEDEMWDVITKFLLKLKTMTDAMIKLLEKIKVSFETNQMIIHGWKVNYDISVDKISKAKNWWRVIEKARKSDSSYKDADDKSISLLSHINENIAMRVRNKFTHPTNHLPDLKLPDDVRTGLEEDYMKLTNCDLVNLSLKSGVSAW